MSAEIECTPVDPEVPRRHVAPEQLGERQHEAAHARVDVAVGVDRSRPARRSSGIGSTTPCGYCGAEPTTSTVFGPTASAIASTSAVQSSRTGVVTMRMPNRCADLWNAAWALSATTISGAVTPRSMRPRSRAASTAHWIDSVPPLVRNPAARRRPCSRPAVQPTTSDWICRERREGLGVERVLVQEQAGRLLGDVVDRRARRRRRG